MLFDYPVLAYDRAIMIGDRVAAVAAGTREAAEEAARRVEVEYEELPAIPDPLSALAPDATIIHPDLTELPLSGKKPPERPHPTVQGSCHYP